MGDHQVKFKIDTGAAMTAITEKTYITLQQPTLGSAPKLLCGPAKESLNVLKFFEEIITYQDRSALTSIYVVKSLKTNLLGLPVIEALHLMEKLCD